MEKKIKALPVKKQLLLGLIIGPVLGFFLLWLILPKSDSPQSARPIVISQSDFKASRLTEETIKSQVFNLNESASAKGEDLQEVRVIDNAGTDDPTDKIIHITYNVNSDSRKVVSKVLADTAVQVFEVLFTHPDVSEVHVYTTGVFTDQYGSSKTKEMARVGMYKATAEKINWNNFKDQVYLDYNRLLDIADTKMVATFLKD